MAIERTKEEIDFAVERLERAIKKLETGCGVCRACREDLQNAKPLRAILDTIKWMQGDDDTPLEMAARLQRASDERHRESRMRAEKRQGIVVADLFRRSGIGEPKE